MKIVNCVLSGLALWSMAGCTSVAPAGQGAADRVIQTPTSEDRASLPYRACVSAIARELAIAEAEVAVISFRYSEAGSEVVAQVPQAEDTWSCMASNAGEVDYVMFDGSEGAA